MEITEIFDEIKDTNGISVKHFFNIYNNFIQVTPQNLQKLNKDKNQKEKSIEKKKSI